MFDSINITICLVIIFFSTVGALDLYFIAKALITRRFRKVLLGKLSIIVFCITLISAACFLYGYFIEPYNVEVSKMEIKTGKLHKASLRIVQISDMHCDEKVRNEFKIQNMINSLNPDVIVFTGDALNSPNAVENFRNSLKGLKASLGKFAVKGNWYLDESGCFLNTGFTVLENDSVKLVKDNEPFYISGMNFYKRNMMNEVMKELPSEAYNIFLYHTPDLVEDIDNNKVDLYLAGHTHGGQIRVPFYGALITLSQFGKKYEMGRYLVGSTTLYVNKGLGMEGGTAPRVRFLARPEVAVFDIKPGGEK